MAGLYVHVPFCRRACSYCDFYFSVNKRHEDAFFEALGKELVLRRNEIAGPLDSVYFGGGTPSYAEPGHIAEVLESARRLWGIKPEAEITLEANPDDITPSRLRAWKNAGINRLSIGVQSFDDEHLARLGRTHDSARVERALADARRAGFDNITIDLIYGLPGMDPKAWEKQVQHFLGLNLPHLSAYALTVEPGTLLAYRVRTGRVRLPDDSITARQFELLRSLMAEAGYRHYEISNWARPGFEGRHNSAYWEGLPYLGAGPSAHSYDGQTKRRWNTANLHKYIRGLQGKNRWFEEENLSRRDLYNEYVMTRLRTDRGVDERELEARFPEFYPFFRDTAGRLLDRGMLIDRDGRVIIAPESLFLADGVIESFFVVEDPPPRGAGIS
ncbi:MAG: radical SAM family heme chaperone HemW [Chlorobi bacterium]|nr:radical SAM family heme chaperone HemW [Chlorobiota bacterium]